MGKIGAFGDIAFSVSTSTVRTFDEMSWDVSAKYATHDRHIKADLLEYQGPELEMIAFDMHLSVFLGVDPLKEIKKLREKVRSGKTERLVIGGKIYGDYMWVIEKMSIGLKRFDGNGNLWEATVNVTLKEYAKR